MNLFGQGYSKYNLPCPNMTYSIHVHNIKPFYNLNFSQNNKIYSFIDSLNIFFAPGCIQFKICKIDSIYDYNYYFLTDDRNKASIPELEMMTKMYNDDNFINLYLTGDYEESKFNGIADSNSKKPYICTINPNLFTIVSLKSFYRLFLNYFGLKPTALDISSMELVNGSNGKMTADSMWDTPADPYYILPPVKVEDSLLVSYAPYFYNRLKDANGQYYDPMFSNIMSDYVPTSYCHDLTHEQWYFLINNAIRSRKKQW